jgi:hypothetical protein
VSSAISKDEVQRLLRTKMDYNSQIIMSASEQIVKATVALQEATRVQSMDKMNTALKEIVDASVSCRSRLQFMRGVWSYYKDLNETIEASEARRYIE